MEYRIHILHRRKDGQLIYENSGPMRLAEDEDFDNTLLPRVDKWVRSRFRHGTMLKSDYVDVLIVSERGCGRVLEILRYNANELSEVYKHE